MAPFLTFIKNNVADFGLVVDYKDARVTIQCPNEYGQSSMCGICGNWNGDPIDDVQHDQDQWIIEGDDDRR